MKEYGLFDIIGPIMVGPSSSHTAGAARLGFVARGIAGESIQHAKISLHGSFASTGYGHGTHLALLAGLLGLRADDDRLSQAFQLAEAAGLTYEFAEIFIPNVNANTVLFELTGQSGETYTVLGSSLGGGKINIVEFNGFKVNFNGQNPTILCGHIDQPGMVAKVSSFLAANGYNMASAHLLRKGRGEEAMLLVELDMPAKDYFQETLANFEGMLMVRVLPELI